MPLTEDIEILERSIRQLQIEWEKFFGGAERKPPNELKARVEALIRQYAYSEIRNNTERFRYQTLSARYGTFNELWAKRLRALEEGRPIGVPLPRAATLVHTPVAAVPAAPIPRANEWRVSDASRDTQAVRELFERFLEERQKAGERGAVAFESFQKVIAQQTSRILNDKGARAVDFRFETKQGKVSLKAKVIR